jgi:hypothetical protein
MQIIWMVLVTLVLALGGILGLALVTRIAAWPGAVIHNPSRDRSTFLLWCAQAVTGYPRCAATGGGCQPVACWA